MFLFVILSVIVGEHVFKHKKVPRRPRNIATESNESECSTTVEKMSRLSKCRGMEVYSKFRHKFSKLEGRHKLNEFGLKGKGSPYFFFFLYVFEVGFHLFLHPFFIEVLNSHRVAPR
ncbi:hypothetical protein ES332_A07G153200v1 [Gossypium tomentosum]|uniref:Uncharacterized protein n=1 Tax=Gossypium tomentosum TaxID=34277 RepID=A0A5D2PTA6_GOSTO|nr:hypothetical protein ES332_A07G153200v1 [Gossypium tomentosum]